MANTRNVISDTVIPAQPGFRVYFFATEDPITVSDWVEDVIAWRIEIFQYDKREPTLSEAVPITASGPADGHHLLEQPNGRVLYLADDSIFENMQAALLSFGQKNGEGTASSAS